MATPPEAWEACPPGELTGLGRRLRLDSAKQARARAIQRGSVGLAAVLLVSLTAWNLMPSKLTPQQGGISCTACLDRFASYEAHLTGGAPLPTAKAAEMTEHLANCEACRAKFDERYPGVLDPVLKTAGAAALLLLLGARARALP